MLCSSKCVQDALIHVEHVQAGAAATGFRMLRRRDAILEMLPQHQRTCAYSRIAGIRFLGDAGDARVAQKVEDLAPGQVISTISGGGGGGV